MTLVDENIYSVKEFAKLIKVTRTTVMKMIRDKKILAFRLSDAPKSPWRIKGVEIERLISFQLQKSLEEK